MSISGACFFDKLIAEQELTSEKIAACNQFLVALRMSMIEPLAVIEEATFIYDEFYEDWQIDWKFAIEKALVYYAVARKHDHEIYQQLLKSNPFIASIN